MLVVVNGVIPSNMKGQDLSTPAGSYTLPKSTFSDHPSQASSSRGRRETYIRTLSSSVGAGAAALLLLLLLLLLYIWFEGGSGGWLDGAVRDRPVLTWSRKDLHKV